MVDVKKLIDRRIGVLKAKRDEASRNKLNGVAVVIYDYAEEELKLLQDIIDFEETKERMK